MDNKMLS